MTIANQYALGSTVRIEVEFRDQDGNLTDPTDVFARYANPAGTVTSLDSGVDAALEHDGTGLYHVDVDGNRVGDWHYRWEGDDFTEEGWFRVNPSLFSP